MSKSWVLTGYTIDSNTDAKGRGSDLSNATQNDPIRTRAELGAALKSAANIRRIFDIPGEENKNVVIERVEDGGLSPVIGEENRRSLYRDAYRAVPKEILSDVVGDLGIEGGLDIRGKFRNLSP